MTANARTIAIIGGGYSGTLTAVNILRTAGSADWRVLLIEKDPLVGRGLAYRFGDDNLLLNVPAGNMSALADAPEHFVAFCQDVDPSLNAKSFISRRLYGEYLEFTLAEAEKARPGMLERIGGEAVTVVPGAGGEGFTVGLADGRQLTAAQVVLAFGHFPPEAPAALPPELHSAVVGPWDFSRLDALDGERPVAVLGMGHTAIDVVFRLTSCNARRQVVMISRRGLLPQGHRFHPQPPQTAAEPDYLFEQPPTIRAYTRALRREVARREALGDNWRDAINDLRAHTPRLWQALPEAERQRFLSRVLPFWDIHRHRLAPGAARRLAGLLESGQVERIAGRLLGAAANDGGLRLQIRPRGHDEVAELPVSALVNCAGPNYDLSRVALPIVRHLLAAGLIHPDRLGLGLLVDDAYRVLDADRRPVRGLHYVGPMLKATYWEAIAVPELRHHTRQLAVGLTS